MLSATTPGLLEHFGLERCRKLAKPRRGTHRGPSRFRHGRVDNAGDANPGDRRKCLNLRVPRRYCCNAGVEHIENIVALPARPNAPMFFTFPDDARWSAERQAVEFGVEIGEYRGVVRVPRRVSQRPLPDTPTPERCVEAYCLQRTHFERAAERKLRRRQVTEDGDVEITAAICVRALPWPPGALGCGSRSRQDVRCSVHREHRRRARAVRG